LKRRRETTPKLNPLSRVSTPDNYRSLFIPINPFLTSSCRQPYLTKFTLEEEEFITNWDEVVESFDDMGLKEGVLRGIYGHGFVKPSPIQQKGILPVI
jgi:hypothetical protein